MLLTLAGILLLPLGAFLWWVEGELAPRVTEVSAREVERVARLAAELVGDRPFTDSIADRLGALTGRRVTLVGPDGRVLGDSEVPVGRLPSVENHAGRPEVRAALEGRVGSAVRESRTVNRTFLYVAIPHARGVVRLSRPADPRDALPARARRLILAALIGTLGLSLLLLPPLTRFVLRPVRVVRTTVQALAAGEAGARAAAAEERGEVGALARAVNALADRTRDTVAALRAERDDLDALFESLDDGLAVIDGEGTVVRANPAFARWAGRQDATGHRMATLFRSPDLVSAVERGLRGRTSSREVVLGERTALLVVQPQGDGALVMLHDLTHLRRLEGVRRDFVTNVSHELKTPLTSVIGFAEAAVEGDPTPEQAREFAHRILANARRMRRLVDALLDLARIESGPWEPRREAVDVASTARRVWRSLQPGPETRNVRLAVGEEARRASVDPDALRQVLRNLFDNALRYAPEGSTVRLDQEVEGGEVRVRVTDAGPGIPSAHLSRVFERFYRVDPARSRAAGGTGLGLAIVKHLVTAHGGRVGVESEVGRGTTVWFTLPAAEPALAGRVTSGET